MTAEPHPDTAPHYTALEDVQGLFVASAVAALGIHLLRAAGLFTGGTAGMALLIAYVSGWSFGAVFFAINLPFFAFALYARGLPFCLKSLATVTLVSLMAEALEPLFDVSTIHPGVAALLFGTAAGMGLLGLFRHSASLGGVSIVALVVQDKLGIRAGWLQLGHDVALFAVAVFVLPLPVVAWSLLGAVILNYVVAMNHRRDWYVVT